MEVMILLPMCKSDDRVLLITRSSTIEGAGNDFHEVSLHDSIHGKVLMI
jgi:hypothetical protein